MTSLSALPSALFSGLMLVIVIASLPGSSRTTAWPTSFRCCAGSCVHHPRLSLIHQLQIKAWVAMVLDLVWWLHRRLG